MVVITYNVSQCDAWRMSAQIAISVSLYLWTPDHYIGTLNDSLSGFKEHITQRVNTSAQFAASFNSPLYAHCIGAIRSW